MHTTNACDQPTAISTATVLAASTPVPFGPASPVGGRVPCWLLGTCLTGRGFPARVRVWAMTMGQQSGAGRRGCPGCVPLAVDLERRLAAYRPTTDTEAWGPVAGQCRCLVRRTSPRSASILRGRLSTLWAILAEQLTDSPDAPVADLVTTAAVNRLLHPCRPPTPRANPWANIRAAAAALHRAAAGVPHAPGTARTRRPGLRTRDRDLSARSARLLDRGVFRAPAAHRVRPVAGPVFSALRPLEGYLPAADLAAHRAALRG